MTSPRESGASLFRHEYDLQRPQESERPVPRLCNLILTDALQSQSGGIRLVPIDAESGGVEYEREGQWQPVMQLPVQVFGAVINRFKVMAALGIGRVPVQEGELHVRLNGPRRVLKIRSEATKALERLTITLPVESTT